MLHEKSTQEESTDEDFEKKVREQSKVFLVLFHRGGAEITELVENSAITVGRSPAADVAIYDQSLSRRHARFELMGTTVVVEDLGSTNGTLVNGDRIQSRELSDNDEIELGSIVAGIHRQEVTRESVQQGLASHDRFLIELESEIARAKHFNRQLAVVMLRDYGPKPRPLRTWFYYIQMLLRPIDRMALYSLDTLEIVLPECDEAYLSSLSDSICKLNISKESARHKRYGPLKMMCGVAVYPECAMSVEALIAASRSALQRADAHHPTTRAPVGSSIEERSDNKKTRRLEKMISAFSGQSAMTQAFETVNKIAHSEITALIVGETGVGKELIAQEIHLKSTRTKLPMVCVNCGAIPPSLIESTLFGHEKGAFTGADRRSSGLFEKAHGSTLFLDEVGELTPQAQTALLRTLETKKVVRVGSNDEILVDVRLLAATNRDLEVMCRDGRFRSDLYYRFNTVTLRIPPLRERLEEIESLASEFIHYANRTNRCHVRDIHPEALALLKRYSWPGNIRELKNVIERAVVLAEKNEVTISDLPEKIRQLHKAPVAEVLIDIGAQIFDLKSSEIGGIDNTEKYLNEEFETPNPDHTPNHTSKQVVDFRGKMQRIEQILILQALDSCNWNQSEAARILRMPLRTLTHKMRSYDLKKRS